LWIMGKIIPQICPNLPNAGQGPAQDRPNLPMILPTRAKTVCPNLPKIFKTAGQSVSRICPTILVEINFLPKPMSMQVRALPIDLEAPCFPRSEGS
jgi:hypothetical protein